MYQLALICGSFISCVTLLTPGVDFWLVLNRKCCHCSEQSSRLLRLLRHLKLWEIIEVVVVNPWLLCPLPAAYLPVSQPFREGHWLVQPLSGSTMSELHRFVFRRAAAHRELPAAEDHRQGKLCQGQAGAAHTDWPRGRFKELTRRHSTTTLTQRWRSRAQGLATAGGLRGRRLRGVTSPPVHF